MKQFPIHGKIKGKGRPRFGNGRTYTPEGTVNYEQLVKIAYMDAFRHISLNPSELPISMEIKAIFERPKSHRNTHGIIKQYYIDKRPTKKPDIDNIAKIICDSLNGLAYKDDAQIVELYVVKQWGKYECVIVSIKELTP